MYKKLKKSWKKHLDFLVLDLVLFLLSYVLACVIRFPQGIPEGFPTLIVQSGLVFEVIYCITALIRESYKNILRRDRYQEATSVLSQVIITYLLFLVYMYVTQKSFLFSRLVYGISFLIGVFLIYGGRIIWKRMLRLRLLNNHKLPHMLVIANEDNAAQVVKGFKKRRYNEVYISGLVVINKDMKGETVEGIPVVCNANEVKQYVLSEVVDEVFLSIRDGKKARGLIKYMLETGISVHICLVDNTKEWPNAMLHKMGGYSVLTTTNNYSAGWKLFLKRVFDIIGGLIGVVVTGVLFLFLAPQIKRIDPGPVFFSQERVGRNGRRFKIYKFRSMYMDAEERKKELMKENQMEGFMFKMDNDPRILPGVGHKIRDWSLDEFPQFINVLKGDMSLVGTRPPTVDEFAQYDAHHKMRLSFKPGITGMWQVSGRSRITNFEQIVQLDNKYIREWNLMLDIKIIFKTIRVVLKKDGAM